MLRARNILADLTIHDVKEDYWKENKDFDEDGGCALWMLTVQQGDESKMKVSWSSWLLMLVCNRQKGVFVRARA